MRTMFNVVLMNTKTFQGKKVVVEAESSELALERAEYIQQTMDWVGMTSKPFAETNYQKKIYGDRNLVSWRAWRQKDTRFIPDCS